MEERDKIVHEARKQAEIAAQKELDAVKQQIQIEKDEAIRDIRRQVAVLSVDIAEKGAVAAGNVGHVVSTHVIPRPHNDIESLLAK